MAYVYRHIRLDKNVPFYIGIGENKYRHSTKWNRNPIWERIVAKTKYEVEILFHDVSWEFACQKEIEFIKLYGRINRGNGTLANMTDGGDGNLGLKHSLEAIKKIAEASKGRPGHWKGKKMSEEYCKRASEIRKGKPIKHWIGRPVTEFQKQAVIKHSIGNKYHLGKTHTEESKRKMSDAMKGRIAYNRKPVFQYSSDGIFIKKYDFVNQAKKETGAMDIHTVCSGQRRTSAGYMWRYAYEGDKINEVRPIDRGKRVIQYNMNGELVAEYVSAKEAEKITGFKSNVISRAATGSRPHAYNFKWEIKYEKKSSA